MAFAITQGWVMQECRIPDRYHRGILCGFPSGRIWKLDRQVGSHRFVDPTAEYPPRSAFDQTASLRRARRLRMGRVVSGLSLIQGRR